MSLNLKDKRVEVLVGEIIALTGETKTGAARKALQERRDRLMLGRSRRRAGVEGLRSWLEAEVWPQVPAAALGAGDDPR
jgi:antitoxin VapB